MRNQIGKISSEKEKRKYRRKLSIRAKISGSCERPRLSVCRTNKHLSVQVIDDAASLTLFSVQTYGKNAVSASNNKDGAVVVGAKIAEVLKSKNISTAVFDRSGYKYTGVVAALVDSIRENGVRI